MEMHFPVNFLVQWIKILKVTSMGLGAEQSGALDMQYIILSGLNISSVNKMKVVEHTDRPQECKGWM